MRIGGAGQARLSLVRQSPLLRGRFSFQDEVYPDRLVSVSMTCPQTSVSAISLAPPPRTAQQRPEPVSEINVAQPPTSLRCATTRHEAALDYTSRVAALTTFGRGGVAETLTRAPWDITACQFTARGRPGGRGRAIESMWTAQVGASYSFGAAVLADVGSPVLPLLWGIGVC